MGISNNLTDEIAQQVLESGEMMSCYAAEERKKDGRLKLAMEHTNESIPINPQGRTRRCEPGLVHDT